MSITAYATSADVAKIWSAFGVLSRTDDDYDGSSDTGIVDAALEQASCDINRCLLLRYSVATVVASTWAMHVCATLAAVLIARRRGNPVPESLANEAKAYMEQLEEIRRGEYPLMGDTGPAAPADDEGPMVENYTVQGWTRRSKIRRIETTSTGGPAAVGQTQFNAQDWGAYL